MVWLSEHTACRCLFTRPDVDSHCSVSSQIGEVSCDSWESGISMAFKDLNIHNASMEGLSTSLELPPELLKPLVVKGVNYALPVRRLCQMRACCRSANGGLNYNVHFDRQSTKLSAISRSLSQTK